MLPEGPPRWPPDDAEIRAALDAAWADGSWGRYHGPHGEQLAERLGQMHGVEHVELCCSGTVAVELALHGLGVGPGDEVVLAGYDFGGNFRSIEAVGALPVLVDVHEANWNFDPARLAAAIAPDTRAVIVSHLHGGIVPMRAVCAVAEERGIAVVEDACQAPGSLVEGRLAGTWGDAGVFSFGGSKLLSAGRGGALLTKRDDVRQRVKLFCQRGNHAFPLSELQAAVVLPQLEQLAERNRRRSDAVARLLAALEGQQTVRPLVNDVGQSEPGYYKVGLKFDGAALGGRTRDEFIAAVQAEGVALDAGFRDFAGRSQRRCRHAEPLIESRRAGAEMMVLHHPVLLSPPETIDRVAEAILKVVRAWSTR